MVDVQSRSESRAPRHAAGAEQMAGSSAARVPLDQPGYETIPCGRHERFITAEYDVVPRGGFDIVERNYYSPVPDLATLPEWIWSRCSELPAVALDTAAAMGFIEDELAPFVPELRVPRDRTGEAGTFYLHNENFESVDAELLYAVVRAMRPRRIVELGSGFSTLLINIACRRNAEHGTATDHVAFDPFPREHILGAELPPAPTRLETLPATEIPIGTFLALGAGDVLFVDTTHSVKIGSDVNFVILDVMPRLAPGVLIHFHDIFLPWEYPRTWFEERRYFWNEQYLLQAFLAFNDEFEILIPAHAVAREHTDRLRAVVPSFCSGGSPASMWLRRRLRDAGPAAAQAERASDRVA